MFTTEQLDAALAGRYTIDRRIGEGGMATVYLARDVKHERRVAVKVLRPDLGAVLGVERFLSEIRVTANLQHPNLLPLFDSGESGGLLFYVMPFIEGESLRARLQREKQLPVEESVQIAIAIGNALDYAHRHGVIHRDLKPENILLAEGQPLVADFGIALAVSNAGGGRITQTGLSLGTPQYMSPEQATGDRVVDARADVYSLGAVTYEMLVGEPPHTGSTSQAIIARVLTERPRSIRASRASVPLHVEAAVERALEKIAPDRFATAREFNEALTGARPVTSASQMVASAAAPATRGRRGVRELAAWGIAAVAVAIAAVQTVRTNTRTALVPAEFEVMVPDSVRVTSAGAGYPMALSRDGSTMVFTASVGSGFAMFVRRMGERTVQEIRGAEGGRSPALSPSGDEVLFTTPSGQLRRVSVRGGTPRTVSDSAVGNGQASWGDAGQIVYNNRNRLYIVSENGGPVRVLAAPDSARRHVSYGWPTILPGGRAALITIWRGLTVLDSARIGVVTIPEGKVTELGDLFGTNPRYSTSGHVLYVTQDNLLFAVPFSARSRELTGSPTIVAEGVGVGPGGPGNFDVAVNGTLAYVGGDFTEGRQLVTVSRSGADTVLDLRPGFYQSPRVSPGGDQIALTAYTGRGPSGQTNPNPDIWRFDMRSKVLSRFTTDSTSLRSWWSPDGSRIAYVAPSDTTVMWRELYANARAVPVAVVSRPYRMQEIVFGRQPGYGVVRVDSARTGATNQDLFYFHTDTLAPARPMLVEPYNEVEPRISPNGRLLAYSSNRTGRYEVYVRAFPVGGEEVQVTRGGGSEPLWSPAGTELFFRGPQHLMTARITTTPRLDVARVDTLFRDTFVRNAPAQNYGVFPDGKRFVMLRNAGSATEQRRPLVVRVNWSAGLGRAAP